MEKLSLGFAMTGSFCTWSSTIPVMKKLTESYNVYPILSPIGYVSNNRFGNAASWIEQIEGICGRRVWHTIEDVEPIGPKNILRALVIAPCTGNTLGKIANGVNDTAVTMAVKSNLRNGNPVVLAVSTNDALTGSARNIGSLLNTKNVYFVPMSQDDPVKKPASMVAHFDRLEAAVGAALDGRQIQPLYITRGI